jgi:hypothetical protein
MPRAGSEAPLPLSLVVFFVFFFFAAAAVLDRVPSVAATVLEREASVAAAVLDRVPSVSAAFDGRVFSLLAPLEGGGEVATDPLVSDSVALSALTPLPVLKQRPNIVDANVNNATGEWLPCSTKKIVWPD